MKLVLAIKRCGSLAVLAALLFSLALALAPSPLTYAAGFTVTTTADTDDGACDADCSLREAINAANATPSSDTIRVPAGIYTLALGRLTIASDLTIRGAEASKTLIDGGALDKVFEIASGEVTITRVTIQNGRGEDGSGIDNFGALLLSNCLVRGNNDEEDGGGIRNAGTLTMKDCSVTGNAATTGGGINNLGTATITSSTISGNTAINGGGGIINSGAMYLKHMTIAGNSATEDGGSIFNYGALALDDSIVTENHAQRFGGGIYNAGTLTTTGSTIRRNQSNTGGVLFGDGGGIYNASGGEVTLRASSVTENLTAGAETSACGGGIYSDGTLTLEDSRIHDNWASRDGGGIYSTGTVSLVRSTVSANATGDGNGGGIRNEGTLTVTDSTIRDNITTEDGGGGIFNAGALTLERSTLNGNTGVENGGALYNTSTGTATLTNSTISGNSVQDFGGGIFNLGGTLHLNNVTITLNRADANGEGLGDGGGAANQLLDDTAGLFTIQNTIIAGNRDSGDEAPDCLGTLTSLGRNLIGNLAGCTIVGNLEGNIVGEARLRPLADNGGLTRTHALKPDSPAIDAGSACESADQRGVSRNAIDRCARQPTLAADAGTKPARSRTHLCSDYRRRNKPQVRHQNQPYSHPP